MVLLCSDDSNPLTFIYISVSRGFGFVTFEMVSEADACIARKKEGGHELDGKTIEVKRAIPREFQEPSQHEKSQR